MIPIPYGMDNPQPTKGTTPMASKELSTLSFSDLVRKVGGTPDSARPVIFPEGNHQFKAPGTYESDPMSSIPVYDAEVKAMYEYIEQSEALPYGYNDVAVCMTRVLRRCDGGVTRSKKPGPFKLPSEQVIETGYDRDGNMRHETVPGDWMTIPGLEGQCRVVATREGTGTVTFQFRRFCQDAINGFFAYIREELQHRSIYRGQIITSDYKYVNVAGFDRTQVVFNHDLQEAVGVACISPIIDLDAIIESGENPKRCVLLAGPPGTGKTLLFKVSQSYLFEMGMTGVIVPAGGSAKDMAKGLTIARSYMTRDGIVGLFIEDIEKMAKEDRSLALDNLDGSISKSDRILIMMTTNFPDLVDPAFLRQGRVDDYIEVGLPDEDAFTRLIKMRLAGRLASNIEWDRAFEAFHSYTPAWIVGGMSKVIRSVIARTHSAKDILVTTDDLVTGATLMRRQWELQNASANRAPEPETLEQAMRRIVREETADEMSLPFGVGDIGEAVDQVVESRIDGARVNLETETGKPVTGNIATN